MHHQSFQTAVLFAVAAGLTAGIAVRWDGSTSMAVDAAVPSSPSAAAKRTTPPSETAPRPPEQHSLRMYATVAGAEETALLLVSLVPTARSGERTAIARNVELRFTPDDGVMVGRVLGFHSEIEGGATVAHLGRVFSQGYRSRQILVELELASGQDVDVNAGVGIHLRYVDEATSYIMEHSTHAPVVKRPLNPEP